MQVITFVDGPLKGHCKTVSDDIVNQGIFKYVTPSDDLTSEWIVDSVYVLDAISWEENYYYIHRIKDTDGSVVFVAVEDSEVIRKGIIGHILDNWIEGEK